MAVQTTRRPSAVKSTCSDGRTCDTGSAHGSENCRVPFSTSKMSSCSAVALAKSDPSALKVKLPTAAPAFPHPLGITSQPLMCERLAVAHEVPHANVKILKDGWVSGNAIACKNQQGFSARVGTICDRPEVRSTHRGTQLRPAALSIRSSPLLLPMANSASRGWCTKLVMRGMLGRCVAESG